MVAGREEAVDTALSLQPKRAALISETRRSGRVGRNWVVYERSTCTK